MAGRTDQESVESTQPSFWGGFFRLYSGVVIVFVLALSFILIAIFYFNQSRLESFHEFIAQPYYYFLNRDLAGFSGPAFEQRLAEINQKQYSLLQVKKIPAKFFNRKEYEKLNAGSMVVHENKAYIRLLGSHNQYLTESVITVSYDSISLLQRWVENDFESRPKHAWPAYLVLLQKKFNVAVSIVDPNRMVHGDAQLKLIERGGHFAEFNYFEHFTLYIALQRSGKVLAVGPYKIFDLVPIEMLFYAVMGIISVMGVVVYTLLKGMETHLLSFETAAGEVAQGNFNARVSLIGNSRVENLGVAFNLMAEKIEGLLNFQREMIQSVTHELATPVARTRFRVELLGGEFDGDVVDKQLCGISQDMVELVELIDEILTYSRLQQSDFSLEFEKADLEYVVKEVILQTGSFSSTLKLTVDNQLDDSSKLIAMNRHYMHRAIKNLVGNAVAHANSVVDITLRSEGEDVVVEVADDGPGIAKEDWANIFQPYVRIHQGQEQPLNTRYGLGLSIVQRIIYWHQGEVSVSVASTGGSSFIMRWPHQHLF